MNAALRELYSAIGFITPPERVPPFVRSECHDQRQEAVGHFQTPVCDHATFLNFAEALIDVKSG